MSKKQKEKEKREKASLLHILLLDKGKVKVEINDEIRIERYPIIWTLKMSFQIMLGAKTASLVVQMVKNLPAKQETQVPFLGGEDPLEKGMATHSSILAWRIHGQRSLVGYSPWDCKELDTTEQLTPPQERKTNSQE